jgi:hypothetical protein
MNMHKKLWIVCREKESYQIGIDTEHHRMSDCSCGCKHFLELKGKLGMDWGICSCLMSPRAGLLTFEHMGCNQYEE